MVTRSNKIGLVNWIGLYSFIRRDIARIFRIVTQTLVTPWIAALLYIFIFGYIVGSRIDLIAGVKYIDFVLPGLLMMNVLASSFAHTSSSLYFKRFIRDIEEILIAPFSYLEMVIGFVAGGVFRGVLVGLGVFVIAVFFSAANIAHFWLFLFYLISTAIIFSLLGLLVGLWANGFEQLNILSTFVITPFSFLGGIFYSVNMLPAKLQIIVHLNPFFYFIDGIRYSMIGIRESNQVIGYLMIAASIIFLTLLVSRLFKDGWGLKA